MKNQLKKKPALWLWDLSSEPGLYITYPDGRVEMLCNDGSWTLSAFSWFKHSGDLEHFTSSRIFLEYL